MPCHAAMWTMQSKPRKYFLQLRPVQNRPFDKHRALFQIPWHTNIQNNRRITPMEEPGYEGPPEISRPSCQKHLHWSSPPFASAIYQLAALTIGARLAVAEA
jgi:hypothetical protein